MIFECHWLDWIRIRAHEVQIPQSTKLGDGRFTNLVIPSGTEIYSFIYIYKSIILINVIDFPIHIHIYIYREINIIDDSIDITYI